MQISIEFADELRDQINGLMLHYSPSRYYSDWVCAFCNKRPDDYVSNIEHDEDCTGKRLLAAINAAKDQEELTSNLSGTPVSCSDLPVNVGILSMWHVKDRALGSCSSSERLCTHRVTEGT